MSKKVRIPSTQVTIGMCVVELDRPWLETPFLFQGFIVSSEADVAAVKKYCQHVFIDTDRSRIAPTGKNQPPQTADSGKGSLFKLFQRTPPTQPTRSVEQERAAALQTHTKTSALVKDFMDEVRLGRALDVKALEQGVDDTVESILRNPDAMSWLSQLRKKNALHEQHAMNCCILAIVFGRHLGLPKEELKKLGLCALLHDIGMLKVPEDILQKVTPLTEADIKQINQHAFYGRDLLMTVKDLYFGAVDVANTHHEWINGQGYPRGLDGAQISPFTRIVSIVDTYDDILTDHPYRKARTPFEALKAVHEARTSQLDEGLTKHFIDMVGVFPVGSMVELSTGEVAIVVSTNRQHTMQPKIIKVLDYRKQACKEMLINLAELDPNRVKIVRILKDGDYGLDAETLHNRALNADIP